ncbi:hypothetical protein [Streptomyces europaeiscabiei]|uniref:hypothetical protein n=1 Tax=Streptomyces europaeiscabiei TaxID=146819 RepID=UPI0029A16904|nr:hypothetical protein [Streptomyces europaeiscabiei]MDX2760420.1 hypothetical protein [Streptomyces europaeiscabiei]
MGAGLDELGERQHPGCRLALGALESALGHADGLADGAAQQRLHGHGGQDVAAELDITAGPRQAQSTDEVTPGSVMAADVERRPSGDYLDLWPVNAGQGTQPN